MKTYDELNFAFIEVGDRLEKITEAIEYKKRFTDTFRLDNKIKSAGIYAITLNGVNINYFAIGKKSGRVATYKDRITFTDFLEVCIPLDDIFEHFPKINERFRYKSGVIRIPPATTKHICNWIEKYEQYFSQWFNNINFNKAHFRKSLAEIERDDSLKLALQMANFDVNRNDMKLHSSGNIPSFLKGIKQVYLSEDEIINHDFSFFGDWQNHKSDIVGISCFEKGNEKLFVWNVNRKPIESVLGVDLIYFVEEYNSFVMVQYKRMKREHDKWVYRPNDISYHKELKNMKEFENITNSNATNNEDPFQFRLNSSPFYFKLCKSLSEINKKSEIIPGLYIPLDYWEKIINHPTLLKGDKGGIAVGYHNANRWLTKDDFTNLVQKGWIGSKFVATEIVSKLIEGSLAGERAITLAAKLKILK